MSKREDMLLGEINVDNVKIIIEAIQFENYREFIYEGSQYTILKLNKKTVFIGDHISDTFDCYEEADFTRNHIVISVEEYVNILKEYAKEIEA